MVVLEPVVKKYVFSRPLQGDEAREVYNEVVGRARKDYKGVPAFDAYFKFNEETGLIEGSNTPYCILTNQVLAQQGLWLPTIQEAKLLDKQGKLSNGVYRGFGAVFYTPKSPNAEITKAIAKQAEKKEWNLPILASIKALGMRKSRKFPEGLAITLKNSPAILTGDEAREYIDNNFDYKGNSGARRINWLRGGGWVACWGRLDDSNSNGRVDWICGEATRAELEEMVLDDIKKAGQREVTAINQKIDKAKKTTIKLLRS